jgi:hypothetical protein
MTRCSIALASSAAVLALLTGACSLGGDDEEAAQTTGPAPSARQESASCRDVAPGARTAIVAPTLVVVREWKLGPSANLLPALGCLVADGRPVEGARVRVNNYLLPEATDENGGFYFPLDVTRPQRALARVAEASEARIDGEALTEEEQRELMGVTGSLIVRFKLTEIEAERNDDGSIRVSGRASYDDGSPPAQVVLYAYELTGKVVGPDGQPLQGAIVATSSLDLEIWSFSPPSGRAGRYRSFFLPSGDDPDQIGFLLRVAVGDDVWELPPNAIVFFEHLKSAQLDVQVPPPGFALTPDRPRSVPGAVYEGLLVGVTVDGEPVTPISARWADPDGRFEFVLPAAVAGKTVRFWQSRLRAFSRTEAVPGGDVDVLYWPKSLPDDAPRDLEELDLPE